MWLPESEVSLNVTLSPSGCDPSLCWAVLTLSCLFLFPFWSIRRFQKVHLQVSRSVGCGSALSNCFSLGQWLAHTFSGFNMLLSGTYHVLKCSSSYRHRSSFATADSIAPESIGHATWFVGSRFPVASGPYCSWIPLVLELFVGLYLVASFLFA